MRFGLFRLMLRLVLQSLYCRSQMATGVVGVCSREGPAEFNGSQHRRVSVKEAADPVSLYNTDNHRALLAH